MKKFIFTLLVALVFMAFSIPVSAQQFTCSSSGATELYGGGQFWVVAVDASPSNSVNVGIWPSSTRLTTAQKAAATWASTTIWLQAGQPYIFEQGTEAIYCLTPSGTASVGVTVRKRTF